MNMMTMKVVVWISLASFANCYLGKAHLPINLVNQKKSLTATIYPSEISQPVDLTGVEFSSLKGKALEPKEYPSLSEIKASLPPITFEKSNTLSLAYAALDVFSPALCTFIGFKFIWPIVQGLLTTPSLTNIIGATIISTFYAIVTGTLSMGMWVTAHECGHGAFSNNKWLQDTVGYIFHSIMLVPYFSWQRSHAVHHANTNHIEDGETHVPPVRGSLPVDLKASKEGIKKVFGNTIGENMFGFSQLFLHLFLGWPLYLLFGATGGVSRGITNHFIPVQFPRDPSRKELKTLFPGSWKSKVFKSDIGIIAMIGVLATLCKTVGISTMAFLYLGPYLVINAWLVGYTWLQHTDVDVPHFPAEGFSYIKGAFHTIDRPYNKLFFGLIDFLHHHIGTTHVAHHIDSTIPHYRAKQATKIIAEKYPDLYLYEDTPIFSAMWRLAKKCFQVESRKNAKNEEIFVFVD